MDLWIVLNQAWDKFSKDEKLCLPEATANQLIGLKMAEKCEEPKFEDQFKKVTDDLKNAVSSMLKSVTSTVSEGTKDAISAIKSSVTVGQSEEEKIVQNGTWKNLAHFCSDLRLVANRGHEIETDNLKKYRQALSKLVRNAPTGLNESVGSEGGDLVPVEYARTLMESALEGAIVRPLATVVPMASNSIKVPSLTDSNHATGPYGLSLNWTAEGGQKTASKPAFRMVELNLHKLVGLCYTTDELIEDSMISLPPLLTRLFSDGLRFVEDSAFINGDGAGKPLGFLNGPATISVTRDTASEIHSVDLFNIYRRVVPSSLRNAVWVANIDTFTQLMQLNIVVGTDTSIPLWIPGNDLSRAPNGMLLGKRLILTEHAPSLGSVGDISLVDFSAYLIGQKAGGGIQTASSIHLRFDFDETAYRFVLRTDGEPWWQVALTPENGTDTLSYAAKLGSA